MTDISPTSIRLAGSTNGDSRVHVPFPPLLVRNVTPFRIEFGLENLGTTNVAVSVNFYLSTDRTITNLDFAVGGVVFPNFTANSSGEYVHTTLVPSQVPAGTYFVGFIVDPGNMLSETFEGPLNSMDLSQQVTVQ